MHVRARSLVYLSKYLIFLQISELASMKQPKNSFQLPKPTINTHKIANKLMTVISADINLQKKNNIICQLVKVKPATSAHSDHSMADVIPCFSVFNIPFETNPLITAFQKLTPVLLINMTFFLKSHG